MDRREIHTTHRVIGARILIGDADRERRDRIAAALFDEGMTTVRAGTAEGFLAGLDTGSAHAAVLGIGLPDADGRDVCAALRARGAPTPVLFLPGDGSVAERLSCFAAGGDDCLTTPVATAELVARVDALMRRSWTRPDAAGETLGLDPLSHTIRTPDGQIPLTPTEFRILARLAAHPGEAVRRHDLIRTAWPDGGIVNNNSLDAHVARLRRKLVGVEGAPAIVTTHRIGYRLTDDGG